LKALLLALCGAACAHAAVAVVSAANYRGGPLAAESIATAFGANLGTAVQVQDSAGAVRSALVFYASPSQINFQIPPGTASGPATVITQGGSASITVAAISPGLFSIDGSGAGTAAALVVVAKSNGFQTVTPAFQCAGGACAPLPLDLGGPNDQAVLELFGTGIRGRSNLSAVTCTIGAVTYAGPQPTNTGLDQVNIALPRTLAGLGTVNINLVVDGQAANTVTVSIPQLTPTQRAAQIVSQMTLDEKIPQLHGIQDTNDYRTIPAVPRLGIPALNITNGPAGATNGGPGHQGPATALPAPIALAASWDVALANQYGAIVGGEAKALANGFVEAPDINIARVPQNGRSFEAFGEDPYLVAQTTVGYVTGMQNQGVIAEVKHYAGNNQETNRTTIDANIDERTLREIYLPAFEAAVKQAHVGAVMCAYNKVNGTYSCENNALLNQILKTEWGFDGVVTSDFGAVHSTIPSANAGLDVEMPTGIWFTSALQTAVQNGQVAMATIDDKLIRRYAAMIRFGVFDDPPVNQALPVQQNGAAARQIAEAGMVLLKNSSNLLPLSSAALHSIALIGPYASKAMTGGGGSSQVTAAYTVSPLAGLQNRAGSAVAISLNDGTNITQAAALAQSADAAIVMVGDTEAEGADHAISLSGTQDQLVQAVAAANPKTVVVIKSGSAILMPWVNSVPAILEAWYPGEEDGNAVAAILFGDVSPSGKLPITFPQSLADLPANTPAQYPGVNNEEYYSEGVLVGYRYYDANQIPPLFPFGHGLAYTTFAYKNLTATPTAVDFDVTNSGTAAGAEVAQLYIGMPSTAVPQPPQQLKGFQKLSLAPGQTGHAHLALDQRAFSYWDIQTHAWLVAHGTYRIMVGSSSRDIRLQDTVVQ
jgi:beta-glucosidase